MIQLENLTKKFTAADERDAGTVAVDDVSLVVDEGEFFVLLGPSGCGKTTTLRVIAGLVTADHGTLTVDNEVMFDAERALNVPPEFRPVSMVFQSYALWPHMTVRQNLSFPLLHGVRRVTAGEAAKRVQEVSELLEIEALLDRPVTTLSGGQQQRVALGRALALRPKVLLMDEPLSNLDARLREVLRVELRKMVKSLGVTTVYVCHDQLEAIALADRIAVMKDGKLLQTGTPDELFDEPKHPFIAQFLGETNTLTGPVVAVEEGVATIALDAATPIRAKVGSPMRPGDPATVTVRIRNLGVAQETGADSPGELNRLPGARITGRFYMGDEFSYTADLAGTSVRFISPLPFQPGEEVALSAPVAKCIAFPANKNGVGGV